MKNLLVVNINYLLMTYHLSKSYDTYFKHDNPVVKLSLMPINLIVLSTQRNLKSIIHLSLLLSWNLHYHLIAPTHFPYKKLVAVFDIISWW